MDDYEQITKRTKVRERIAKPEMSRYKQFINKLMNINIKNLSPNEALIEIEGVIGIENGSQESIATYDRFAERLNAAIEAGVTKLRINIRSTGGSVQDAMLIHSALGTLPDGIQISTHCYGFVASAATIIAQAASAKMRHVASSALYLIHNASTAFEGNAAEANSTADLLAKTDQQIAAIYASRAGLTVDHFAELMGRDGGRGEWLSPEEVVEFGLADVIEPVSPLKNIAATIRNFIQKIFDKSNAEQPVLKASDPVSDPVPDPDPLLLAGVISTKTLPKEDPVIEHNSVILTKNQSAYSQDVGIFRE